VDVINHSLRSRSPQRGHILNIELEQVLTQVASQRIQSLGVGTVLGQLNAQLAAHPPIPPRAWPYSFTMHPPAEAMIWSHLGGSREVPSSWKATAEIVQSGVTVKRLD
jgi:hypothetical protein